jgi:hypothetical protein
MTSPCCGFSGIGDDDAAGGLFLGIDTLDHDTIVKRAESHAFLHLQDRTVIEPGRRDPAEGKNDIGKEQLASRSSLQKIWHSSLRLLIT